MAAGDVLAQIETDKATLDWENQARPLWLCHRCNYASLAALMWHANVFLPFCWNWLRPS